MTTSAVIHRSIWAAAALAMLLAGCGPKPPAPPADNGQVGAETQSGSGISDILQGAGQKANGNSPDDVVLDEAKQKLIWDMEHYTFELEQKFGKRLTTAIKNRSREKLSGFFHDSFESGVVPGESAESTAGKWWTEDSRLGGQQVDRQGIVDYWIQSHQPFAELQRVKMRVLQIAAADEENSWSLHVLLTATGTSADKQPMSIESTHRVRCRFANDEDIESSQILTEWKVEEERLRSTPIQLFEEATRDTGLVNAPLTDNWIVEQVLQYRFQMAVADFDNDGFLDIAVCTYDGVRFVLQSDRGERYTDVTEKLGLSTANDAPSALAAWVDMDNDGDQDLLLGASLYRNDGEKFVDVTESSGLQFAFDPMGCAVADYDADGKLDLYMLYQGGGSGSAGEQVGWIEDHESGAPNQLWKNLGGGRFENVTESTQSGGGTRKTFAAVWFHANDDHLPDLYVANDFGSNQLLINRGDHFEDGTKSANVGDFATSMGVAAGDIDGDGRTELYVANMFSKMGRRIIDHVQEDDYPPGVFAQIQGSCAGNRLYQPAGEGPYRELSISLGVNDVGWAYAPAFADFDNDGLLDIYATTGFLSFDRHKPDG